jgi:hypothetical protein
MEEMVMTAQTDIVDWDPKKGQAYQGDIVLMGIPDTITFDLTAEIAPRDIGLVLAEGEVSGHHHVIKMVPQPMLFRDDAIARDLEAAAPVAAARLYRSPDAIRKMIGARLLTTDRLAIGILYVSIPVVLRHDEHGGLRIPAGRYYVGGQQEWNAGEARRVQD